MVTAFKKGSVLTLFLLVFLGTQVGLPLSYYLGDNAFDERFAWRMFSPVRLAGCSVKVVKFKDGRGTRVSMGREFHVVWSNLLKRNRPSVAEAVGRYLCQTQSDAGKDPDIRISIECDVPEAMHLGICQDHRDRDGDGVPDGYARDPSCQDDTRKCYQRDCSISGITLPLAPSDARLCADLRCRTTALSDDSNVCEGTAWR